MLPATIQSIEKAFQEIKGMCVTSWEGEYRTVARQALTDVIQTRMRSWVDRALSELQTQDVADRRNGTFGAPEPGLPGRPLQSGERLSTARAA